MGMSNIVKRIGTHDGVFHCDEVLACFMLRKLPEYKNSEIIRSRDEKILNTCDVVVDVGSVYDPQRHRYDHHQKGFTHTMKSLVPSRPWDIKLSSAGLVYHHFGERILKTFLESPHDPDVLKNLYSYMYENLIQEVDGIDNGIPMYESEPRYQITTNLSARVQNLNPMWNSTEDCDPQKLFYSAMDLVGKEFTDRVQYFVKAWWPAREVVKEAVVNRFKTHESGEIIELNKCCPWQLHLFALEKELNIENVLKFVIYPDKTSWRVMGVSVMPKSFIKRLFLEEEWRGLNNQELSKVSGINDCIFVHASGFIGGNKTREGAIEMAVKTIKLHNEKK